MDLSKQYAFKQNLLSKVTYINWDVTHCYDYTLNQDEIHISNNEGNYNSLFVATESCKSMIKNLDDNWCMADDPVNEFIHSVFNGYANIYRHENQYMLICNIHTDRPLLVFKIPNYSN